MPFPTDTASAQLRTVQQWYDAVAAWDFDALGALLADTYEHRTLPASARDPPKNKAQGLTLARTVAAALDHLALQYEVFQWSEGPGHVWVHSRLYSKAPGAQGIEFNNESVFIFTFGTGAAAGGQLQIATIQEFVDTKFVADFKKAAAAGAALA
ncbi:hypothetical protein BC834DRAFT_971586 [Gloeopeniophorella convolvens]|nr:hypothetical protein BC834DRAFT_971586 [Gloeopeniophorella convolvens]